MSTTNPRRCENPHVEISTIGGIPPTAEDVRIFYLHLRPAKISLTVYPAPHAIAACVSLAKFRILCYTDAVPGFAISGQHKAAAPLDGTAASFCALFVFFPLILVRALIRLVPQHFQQLPQERRNRQPHQPAVLDETTTVSPTALLKTLPTSA